MQHLVLIPFFFILGSCVGSFLNVVVWRLPRIEYPDDAGWLATFAKTLEGLSNPPSHCPKCNEPIRWYDNIPVLGWIKLGGKCRFCKNPISMRYPIVEAIVGLLFAFYYVMFFIVQVGPSAAQPVMVPHDTLGTALLVARPLEFRVEWPIYLLDMALIGALLAASLIDAELFIIPIEIPWVMAAAGIITHAVVDRPSLAGALNATPTAGALAAGGAVGLVISIILLRFGKIPQSFPDDEPMQDVNPAELLKPSEGKTLDYESKNIVPPPPVESQRQYTRWEIYAEIFKEMLFLLPPLVLAIGWWLITAKVHGASAWWHGVMSYHAISGLLGAVLGALVGGLVVWITRILGTFAFGRLAMGLGDVHLMFGVGAVIGAGCSTIAFFLAPFFGIATAIYLFLSGKRRELPYGPYLSMATAFVLLYCCPIVNWLAPGVKGLQMMIGDWFGGGSSGGTI